MAELMEYVDRMYHTVMNKDVALEYSRTQISVLHKELEQNRVRSEDDRKALIGTLSPPPHTHTHTLLLSCLFGENVEGYVGLTPGMLVLCAWLLAEVDTVKEQVVKMEENFLLWRTRIRNDQMSQQEEFLQERLIKQDRVSHPFYSYHDDSGEDKHQILTMYAFDFGL